MISEESSQHRSQGVFEESDLWPAAYWEEVMKKKNSLFFIYYYNTVEQKQ